MPALLQYENYSVIPSEARDLGSSSLLGMIQEFSLDASHIAFAPAPV
jgi:hypothetical protein